jgi:hypothetical protein
MTYIDWFNHRRLHGTITDGPGYTTPAAHETQPGRTARTNQSVDQGLLRLAVRPMRSCPGVSAVFGTRIGT